MPIAVKFSEQFYRKLGHEAVDELVNWFNQVDTTYRADLRELNEHNFARFDAKLEQRVADVRQEIASLRTVLGESMAALRGEMGVLRGEMGVLRGEFRAQLEAEGKTLTRWMVGLWISAIGLLAAVILAGLHFLPAARP